MQHSFNHFSFYSCDTTSYILLLFVLVLLDSPGNRRIIQIAFAAGLSTTSGAVLFHLWHHRHVVSRVNASEYLKMASQSLWVTFSKWDNQLFTSPYRMKIRYLYIKEMQQSSSDRRHVSCLAFLFEFISDAGLFKHCYSSLRGSPSQMTVTLLKCYWKMPSHRSCLRSLSSDTSEWTDLVFAFQSLNGGDGQ